MNGHQKARQHRDKVQRRDWARFEVVHKDVVVEGETPEEFLARGGQVKKLAGPRKRQPGER